MKHNTKAFTLIELLVVVLIISILSAVALPQYKRAVDKSRLTEKLVQARALLEAQDAYVIITGSTTLTADMSALSIEIPSGWTCSESAGGFCKSEEIGGVIFEVSTHHGVAHLAIMCLAGASDSNAQNLCTSFGGTYSHDNQGKKYYRIFKK